MLATMFRSGAASWGNVAAASWTTSGASFRFSSTVFQVPPKAEVAPIRRLPDGVLVFQPDFQRIKFFFLDSRIHKRRSRSTQQERRLLDYHS